MCSNEKRIGNAVGELAGLGFKNIELTGGTEFYEHIEEDLVKLRQDYGLNFMVHNFFPPPKEDFVINLASRKPEIKEKVASLVKKALRLLEVFGKNLYTIHPGLVNEVYPKLKDNFFTKDPGVFNTKDDFYKMLEFLSCEVIPEDFRIGVENLTLRRADDKFSFLCVREDIEQFLAYFKGNRKIGMLFDLGHFDITSAILGFDRDAVLCGIVDRYADKIFAFHLSGNNGYEDLHAPLPADSWQLRFLKKNRDSFKNVPVVLEWHGVADKEAFRHFQEVKEVLN